MVSGFRVEALDGFHEAARSAPTVKDFTEVLVTHAEDGSGGPICPPGPFKLYFCLFACEHVTNIT